MSIRSFLNQNPVVTTTVAVLVLAVVLWFMLRPESLDGPAGGPVAAYWIEADSEEIFVAPTHPVPDGGPSGGHAFRIHVWGCQTCAEPENETWYAQRTAGEDMPEGAQVEVVSNDLQRWYAYDSPQGRAIREVDCPDGVEPVYCRP